MYLYIYIVGSILSYPHQIPLNLPSTTFSGANRDGLPPVFGASEPEKMLFCHWVQANLVLRF